MSRFKLSFTWAIFAVIVLAGLAPPAQAAFELYVQEYTATGNAVGAAQTYFGTEPAGGLGLLSSGFTTTPSGNFTYLFSATENSSVSGIPTLHLNSFTLGATSSTTDFLVVGLSEGGPGAGFSQSLTGPLLSQLSSIPNIGNAMVTLNGFADNNNNLFGVPVGTDIAPPGTLFTPPLVPSTGAVAAPTLTGNSGTTVTSSAPFSTPGAFSMTQVITVSGLSEYQTISFDSVSMVLPVPGGLVLAISGLPIAGLYYLKRRRVDLSRA